MISFTILFDLIVIPFALIFPFSESYSIIFIQKSSNNVDSKQNTTKLNKGIMEAKLVSSKELTDEEQKKISDELSKAIGASLTFNYSVNENLLGGFKIQVGSILIDTSIRNKLNRYLTLTTNNR